MGTPLASRRWSYLVKNGWQCALHYERASSPLQLKPCLVKTSHSQCVKICIQVILLAKMIFYNIILYMILTYVVSVFPYLHQTVSFLIFFSNAEGSCLLTRFTSTFTFTSPFSLSTVLAWPNSLNRCLRQVDMFFCKAKK